MTYSRLKRLVAAVLVLAMVLSLGSVGVYAVGGEPAPVPFQELDPSQVTADLTRMEETVEETASYYEDGELVRVTIVLEAEPALSVMGLEAAPASAYRQGLQAAQERLAARISSQVLDGQKLDVVWNLTLAENAISANVAYGKLREIRALDGVKAVYLETRYLPMTAGTSNVVAQETTGAAAVQSDAGYTGAGIRVAVIDSGTDTDHQSFDNGGYLYALSLDAERRGLSPAEYLETLDLLDREEIASVLDRLHAAERYDGLTAEDLYLNEKLPFNFNYVDGDLDVTHDNDTQGEHGSHVAGIAAANDYIPAEETVYDFNDDGKLDQADAQALLDHALTGSAISNEERADISGNGSVTAYDAHLLLDMLAAGEVYVSAEETVGVSGVAPNAQLLTMKVFGKQGGAYSSDYMAAVEDAVVLGCTAVNLSLGAPYPGFVKSHEDNPTDAAFVDGVMEQLTETGLVMCVAAGNSGNWADNDDAYGYMYTDEAGTATISDPAVYENTLSVASADNVGGVLTHDTSFGEGLRVTLEDTPDGINEIWNSLDTTGEGTTYEVVFLGDPSNLFAGETQTDERIYAGADSDFDGVDYTGKVVLVARGNGVYFSAKHMAAAKAGAAAVLIYNNTSGALRGSIAGSTATAPCAGLSMEDAQAIFALCRKNEDGAYATTVTVKDGLFVDHGGDASPEMSDFSSWGTTGALTIKPEITAPGGNIYSVNGLDKSGTAYELMSGTSMATPHVTGLTALAAQYLRETGLLEKARTVSGLEDLSQRNLTQSLLMSTAQPLVEAENGVEYSVRNQGAGMANVEALTQAESYLLVDGQSDGKVKAELGDGTQGWSFSFEIYNLSGSEKTYDLDASILTTDTYVAQEGINLSADAMTRLGAELTCTGSTVSDGQVTVPANGAAKVTVELEIPEKTVEHMVALGYTNGFYVEGFLYLRPVADGEGRLDVTHSIPLLGFYGNWTDPSMFDTGSFLETAYGTATRPSHLNSEVKNVITWCPKGYGAGLYYTGNIYGSYGENGVEGDGSYCPERNAVSTLDSSDWQLYALFPTLIRNATDVEFRISNAETGEVYYVNDYETFDDYMLGSFYYANAGQWYDTTGDYGIGLDWDYIINPETGEKVPEGTRLRYTLLCAPDYYVNEDGSVRWDELGEGAKLSCEFTVDNTAPKLSGSQPLTISADGGTLYYTAQDENYVAAVILLNGAASTAVDYSYPDMPVANKGKAVSGALDLTGFREQYGNKAVVAVCDYAGNQTYYVVNLGGTGSSYGQLVAFQNSSSGEGGTWVAMDPAVEKNETGLFVTGQSFVCAEYVNGYVFAQTENGNLYGFSYADFLADRLDLESTYIAHLDNVYQDLAYSYGEGVLYGLLSYIDSYDNYPTTEIYSINLKGAYYDEEAWMDVEPYQEDWTAGRGGVFGLTLACDDEGSLYILGTVTDDETGESSTAQLWKAAMEENWGWVSMGPFRFVGDTGLEMDYLQSMTWDHNTETLYWAHFYATGVSRMESTLEQIDPATGECTRVGTLSGETSCLFAPLTPSAAAQEAHANVPVMDPDEVGTPILRDDVVTMNVGASQTLLYDLDPWYTNHKEVVWSTDDETIATVDQSGCVTAIADGSCTITVAAKDDPAKFDTCTIQVAALDLSFEGIISAMSAGIGNVSGTATYKYDMVDGIPSYGTVNAITWPEEFRGYGTSLASSAYGRGSIWTCEYGNSGMIYEIDPDTGVVKEMLEPIDGDMMFGMSYAESTDSFNCIMNFYMYVDMPFTHASDKDMEESYNEETHRFEYHRLNMLQYLAASDKNFRTGENGNGSMSDIVFCGITTIEGGESQYIYKDFLGNYGGSASYTPTLTLVLLDNVGRLWYIDEITGMQKISDDWGNSFYTDETGEMEIMDGFYGMETVGYDTDGDGEDDTYSVFVIRQLQETPLTDMYLAGTMPRITYHFSDIEYAGSLEDGTPMIAMSLYDYWNNGTTNELYLYLPGHETDEWDYETWEKIRTPDRLFDLGDTGEYNIIATIHKATVTGGIAEMDNQAAPTIFCGWYKAK